MNLLVVVLAQFLFFLGAPPSHRFLDISHRVLAADHESDLARGVCRDGGVSIFDNREDFLAFLLELGDQSQVKPLVFG